MKRKILAIVGMCGAGKSEVTEVLERKGLVKIRFGDITDEVLNKKGLRRNEKNERLVREELRRKYGMAAYARLNIHRIKKALKKADIILDGLYSWEEYLLLKKIFGKKLVLISVYASPFTRYSRLSMRKLRPLTFKESRSRDITEIENINKAGPIAMADYIIVNEGKTLKEIEKEVNRLWRRISRS